MWLTLHATCQAMTLCTVQGHQLWLKRNTRRMKTRLQRGCPVIGSLSQAERDCQAVRL